MKRLDDRPYCHSSLLKLPSTLEKNDNCKIIHELVKTPLCFCLRCKICTTKSDSFCFRNESKTSTPRFKIFTKNKRII